MVGYGLALIIAALGAWTVLRSRAMSLRLAGIVLFAFSAFIFLLVFWGSYKVR